MEKLLEMLIKLNVESGSAVEIAKWYVAAKGISSVLIMGLAFAIVAYVGHRIYKCIDRTYEKPRGE